MSSLASEEKDVLSKNVKWLILCFGSVFIFGLLANAFGMFSPSFLNDTLTLDMIADGDVQYGIGRFFQPLYRRMTIAFSNTYLSNLLWLLFLSLTVFVLVKLFNVKNKLLVVLFSAIISTTPINTIFFGHVQWNEIFSLCLFLSAISVYIIKKYDKSKSAFIAFSIIMLLISGLYPSYLCAVLGLVVFVIIIDLLQGKSFKDVFIFALKVFGGLLIGVILFFLLGKIVLKIRGITNVDAYNNSFSVKFLGIKRTIVLVLKGYYLFFYNLIFITKQSLGVELVFVSAHEIFSLVMLFASLSFCLYYLIKIIKSRQLKPLNIVIIILAVLLIPFAFTCVCVLCNGNPSYAIYYQSLLIYFLPIALREEYLKIYEDNKEIKYSKKFIIIITVIISTIITIGYFANLFVLKNNVIEEFVSKLLYLYVVPVYMLLANKKQLLKKPHILKLLMVVLSCICVFSNISFSNKRHTEAYLADKRTSVAVCSIYETIQNTQGFDSSKNKIYIYGMLDVNVYKMENMNAYYNYLRQYNNNYVFVWEKEADGLFTEQEKEIINNMPCYPINNSAGSYVELIGDVLVVKLGVNS